MLDDLPPRYTPELVKTAWGDRVNLLKGSIHYADPIVFQRLPLVDSDVPHGA